MESLAEHICTPHSWKLGVLLAPNTLGVQVRALQIDFLETSSFHLQRENISAEK